MAGDPRDLHALTHSFPTRRSADLPDALAGLDADRRRLAAQQFAGALALPRVRGVAQDRSGVAGRTSRRRLEPDRSPRTMCDGRLRRIVGLSGVMDLRSCVARAVERRWRLGHSRGDGVGGCAATIAEPRSEEHTSEIQSLMSSTYDVFCLKTKEQQQNNHKT